MPLYWKLKNKTKVTLSSQSRGAALALLSPEHSVVNMTLTAILTVSICYQKRREKPGLGVVLCCGPPWLTHKQIPIHRPQAWPQGSAWSAQEPRKELCPQCPASVSFIPGVTSCLPSLASPIFILIIWWTIMFPSSVWFSYWEKFSQLKASKNTLKKNDQVLMLPDRG